MDSQSITYASYKDWLDIMKNRSKVRMHELIERLGLRAKWSSNKRGKTNFESALVRDLVSDMGDVVSTLPKESDELVPFLAEHGSLKLQVDMLLEKFGMKIWGRAGDREHLLTVGEAGVEEGLYPRDLYFENEEDRALIQTLLHWWIGLKACNVILARERLDRERKKKEESRRARQFEHEHAHTQDSSVMGAPAQFVALAPHGAAPLHHSANVHLHGHPMSGTEPARHMQILQIDPASRGSPMSSSMLTPPESSESPIVQGREGGAGFAAVNTNQGQHILSRDGGAGFAAAAMAGDGNGCRRASLASQPGKGASWPATGAVSSQAVDSRFHEQTTSVDTTRPDSKAATSNGAQAQPAPHAGVPYPGLEVDTLQALRAYLFAEKTEVRWEETTLIERIEKIWEQQVRADRTLITDDVALFISRERAFFTWLELRKHLAAIERADQRWQSEGSSVPEIERRIQQHRTLMGASQEILRNFEDISVTGGDRDELLRQALVILAGSKYAVQLQWGSVPFTVHMRWLSENLESFYQEEKEEEEEEDAAMYYMG